MPLLDFFGKRKRFNLHDQKKDSWRARAEAAVAFIDLINDLPNPFKVVEVGAGDRKLERILKRSYSVNYSGYDLLPQSANVRKWDAKNGFPPDIGDVNFALGLLEYLETPELVFRSIGGTGSYVVFSYVAADQGHHDLSKRRSLGWASHLRVAEIEEIASRSGLFIVSRTDMSPESYSIWLARGTGHR